MSSQENDNLLTEQQMLDAPESDYMNTEQLAFFKDRLLSLYESTCERIEETKSEMSDKSTFSDENDRASWEEQCNISLRVLEREQRLLPKIKQSLGRIQSGDYGYCLDSGDPIGIPRLLARPTAEYCAEVKTLKEIQEHHFNG